MNATRVCCPWSRRGAIGVIESVVAILVILVVVIPVVGLVTQSSRTAQVGSRRLVLHLRARRHQAEVAATSFHVVASTAGTEFPSRLAEPTDSADYDGHISNLAEKTTVRVLEPALVEVETTITFAEPAVPGLVRTVRVRRLMSSPTLSLESRYGVRRSQS